MEGVISEAPIDPSGQPRPGRIFQLRVILAAAVFACLIAGGMEPFYFRTFRLDRQQLHRYRTALPFRKLPGLRQFLVDVHASTAPGDSIGLWLRRSWKGGYEYGYQRSAYLLPSRVLLPLIDRHDHFLKENIARSLYLACWRCEPPFPGFVVVKRFPDGTLSRRK